MNVIQLGHAARGNHGAGLDRGGQARGGFQVGPCAHAVASDVCVKHGHGASRGYLLANLDRVRAGVFLPSFHRDLASARINGDHNVLGITFASFLDHGGRLDGRRPHDDVTGAEGQDASTRVQAANSAADFHFHLAGCRQNFLDGFVVVLGAARQGSI